MTRLTLTPSGDAAASRGGYDEDDEDDRQDRRREVQEELERGPGTNGTSTLASLVLNS